jgi:hypothetical protein
MCLAIAVYPTEKMLSTTVANRYAAGTPVPVPKPTTMGTLPVIAVIGAAFATAMKRTANRPIEPDLRRWTSPAAGVVSCRSTVLIGRKPPVVTRKVRKSSHSPQITSNTYGVNPVFQRKRLSRWKEV